MTQLTANNDVMDELELEFKKIDILQNLKISKLKEIPTKTGTFDGNLLKTKIAEKRQLSPQVVEITLELDSDSNLDDNLHLFKDPVGKTFGVIPENNINLVQELCTRLSCSEEDLIHRDLSLPKKSFLRSLSDCTDNQVERKRLLYLSSISGKDLYNKMRGLGLLDVLKMFSDCKPTKELIKTIPELKQRFYSVSQSQSALGPNQVTFAFNITGLCTTYLNSLNPGTSLQIYPRHSNFPKPKDKLLLIANGTGVAPFIGMIQEYGNVKLVYGYRTRNGIYRDVIEEFKKRGGEVVEAVTEVVESNVSNATRKGLNRDSDVSNAPTIELNDESNAENEASPGLPTTKKYVQDYLTIQDLDYTIFVCGSVAMGRGVDQALIRLKVERDGCTVNEAIEYWNKDRKDTYVKELWG